MLNAEKRKITVRKTATVTILTIAFLLSISQADIRQWFKKNRAIVTNKFRTSPKKTNDTIYKWIDEKGIPHFSNTEPLNAKNVEAIPSDEYSVNTVRLQKKKSPSVALPSCNVSKRTPQRKKKKKPLKTTKEKVVLFTANQCEYCKQAVSFLRSRHIAFKEYNIERDKTAKAKMRAAGGIQHVPFAVVNGKKIRGFSQGAYSRALNLPETGNRTERVSYKQKRFRSTGKT